MSHRPQVPRPRTVSPKNPPSVPVPRERPATDSPRSTPCAALLAAAFAIALVPACGPPDPSSSSQGGTGAGGTGAGGAGGCLMMPKPLFALRVLAAAGGPVPPDTTVAVKWSAGEEPEFHLDDKATWGTLETGNVVCALDATAPPPTDLVALECSLWTSGPTEVIVSAKDFVTKDRTFSPEPSTDCNPDPTPIEIEIDAEQP
jgi:hypothetical protein